MTIKGWPATWEEFGRYLSANFELDETVQDLMSSTDPKRLYDLAPALGVTVRALSQTVADFLGLPFLLGLDPAQVREDLLPEHFCQSNLIAPVKGDGDQLGAVVSNPFDRELLEGVRPVLWPDGEPELLVAEPQVIRSFFTSAARGDADATREAPARAASGERQFTAILDADANNKA